MFAFSRDGALPFSGVLYHISERTRTPVRCVWAAAFVAALLGLIAFAGTIAISAVFTVGVVGQYVADSIPIAARWLGGKKLERGPFHLGAFVRIASFRQEEISLTQMDRAYPLPLSPLHGCPSCPLSSFSRPRLKRTHKRSVLIFTICLSGPVLNLVVGTSDELRGGRSRRRPFPRARVLLLPRRGRRTLVHGPGDYCRGLRRQGEGPDGPRVGNVWHGREVTVCSIARLFPQVRLPLRLCIPDSMHMLCEVTCSPYIREGRRPF